MSHDNFGLREFPFKSSTSNSLFLGAAHLDGLAKLEGAFDEPSGLTLLVGDAGIGKTTLIQALLARLNDDKVRIVRLNNPTMSFAEMLDVMVQQIGIHPAGKGKLASLKALETFLSDPTSTVRVVLIFDEAQRLSNEILEQLRLLSDSRPRQRNALQIVLVGRPELAQRLTDPKLRALNQGIGSRALLRPLRGTEIHDYVNCLLRVQCAPHEVFSRGALVEVACLSGGLPRRINDLCQSSLLLAYSDGSTEVEPRHVRAASVEIEYLLDVSGNQDVQPIEARRGAVHWMLGKSKPLMAGWLSALAVAGVLALEFGRGRSIAWFARPANVHRDHKQGGGEFSRAMSAGTGQSDEKTRREIATAAPSRTEHSADRGGGRFTQTPAASAPQPAPPKESGGNSDGTLNVPITAFQAETHEKLTATDSASPEPAAPPPSDNGLTNQQERRLSYEIRRAKSSFGGGNYTNAIYHLKRALLIDPDASEARDLLQRAQAAQSNPDQSAGLMESSPAPSVAVAWPDYRSEVPPEAPSTSASAEAAAPLEPAAETPRLTNRGGPPASASGEVAAPLEAAAETPRLTNRGGPPASASAEVAAPLEPAAETPRLTNRGGPPASASGEVAAPDSAATLPSPSMRPVPARSAVFNIQIQAAMDEKNADQMMHQLQQLGYHPHLVSTLISGRTSFKVEIGPYTSQNEATAAKAELRLKYNSAFDPPAPILGDDSPDLLRPFSPTPLRIGLSTEPLSD